MLVVSWNLAGRVKRLAEQAERLLALDADFLCLQEVTPSTLARWELLLGEAGYEGIEHGEPERPTERSRPLMALTACRGATRRVEVANVPWPERVLAVRLPDGAELLNVHSPISPKPELVKVRTLEAVYAHLADATVSHPRILCGDLNTPRKEHADGQVWTFARDQYGRLREERGERWDRAELALIRGLEPYGFRDAFRSIHGPAHNELSWEWPRWGGGYRLDHLLASAELTVEDCRYEHGWRKEGLSDHSAFVVSLSPSADDGSAAPRPDLLARAGCPPTALARTPRLPHNPEGRNET